MLRARKVLPLALPVSIPLVRLVLGITGEEIRRFVDGRVGLVLQAMGRGNAPPGVADEVRRCVESGIPMVVTSRCIQGAVAPIYGGGGGKDLERAGAWFAGDLAGEKARLLLGGEPALRLRALLLQGLL